MQTYGRANATGPGPVRLLDELKRIAVEQLGAIPGNLYGPIEEQLQERLKLDGSDAQRKDLAAVLALRQRNSGLVMRYRELIARNFEDFRGRPALSRPGVTLGLVGEDELGFHLAGQRLAESIGRSYQRPLELLDLRFESLAEALHSPTTTNPVGAVRLAGAFVRTFHDADLSETLQPVLFRQYEQELSRVLGELYGRLNSQLAADGFHADLRHAARSGNAAPVAAPAPVQVPPPREPISASAAGAGIDLFRSPAEARVEHQRLRDVLHAWRESTSPPADVGTSPGPPRRELRLQEVASVAALLQRDNAKAFEKALSGAGRPTTLRRSRRRCRAQDNCPRRSVATCLKARAVSDWIRTRPAWANTKKTRSTWWG
jgi:hypothetical protein